jgi:type IV pilus assembly protein PilV
MQRRQQNNVIYDNDCRGYSLIEVLIAMAVFAIGVLAIFSMHITATNSNALARGVTENYTAAMDKVEELMARPFNHADLDDGDHTEAMNADGIDNDGDGFVDGLDFDGENDGYISLEWQVSDIRMFDQDIKSVRVTVASTVNRNREKEIVFDFLKADL